MSIDLGSPIFEVALGLAFIYFLFSVVISSAVEGIAKVFQVRERNLKKGVELMLGDKDLADAVVAQPLFRSDATGKKRHRPAYVSSRNFAMALIRALRKEGRCAGAGEIAASQVKKGIDAAEKPAQDQLQPMLEEAEMGAGAKSDPKPESREARMLSGFRAEVERWYDDGMDRVSGWYRSWAQVWTCVLALVVAVGLNVDSIRIAERLGDNMALRSAAVAGAEAAASEGSAGGSEEQPKGGSGEEAESAPKAAAVSTQDALNDIKGLHLPILWGEENDNVTLNTVVGWLVTFLALSLGAPFWFDALSKLAHLRTTGVKPKPAADPEPA